MHFSEARLSALIVSALTCLGLTVVLTNVLHDVWTALSYAAPAAGVMAVVLFLLASDKIKKGGDEPPQKQTTKGE